MTTPPFGSMSVYVAPDDDPMWIGVAPMCLITDKDRTCIYCRESEWDEVREALKQEGVLNEQPRSLH